MRRSEIATLFARSSHDLPAFFNLFDEFFDFGGSPGRSGEHSSLPARFSRTTSTIAISSTLPELSVTTDLDDYATGETATITASGFDAGWEMSVEGKR